MGKTIIAFLAIVHRLQEIPNSRALFLAPTKPLVVQHYNSFSRFFPEQSKNAVVITGEIRPEKRESMYKQARIIFITPQTLQNDIINGRIYLDNFSVIIFDEAHRAVKKYAYVFIAKKYLEQAKSPRVIALTASPGYSIERIQEVIRNLGIEAIEIRTGREPDIVRYMKQIRIEKVEVALTPEMSNIQRLLKDAIDIRFERLKDIGIIEKKIKGKKALKEAYDDLKGLLSKNPKDYRILASMSILSEIIKIEHFLELLETQTLYTFVKYYEEMLERSKMSRSKSLKGFLEDVRVRKAYSMALSLLNQGKEHPKVTRLLEILRDYREKKVMVFVQIKKTAERLEDILNANGIRSRTFLGKSAMKQKDQVKVLKEFAQGEFNVLIATSIGEEGIDIPKVDLVVFYEPVPSEIRYIQRRGRTGRTDVGEVKILVTRGTRDETFYWVAITKERKMLAFIKKLRRLLKMSTGNTNSGNAVQLSTKHSREDGIMRFLSRDSSNEKNIDSKDAFSNEKPSINMIIADTREKDSGVVQSLVNMGVIVKLESLDVGDYIIGEYIIERKTIIDFIRSIIDGRLSEQLEKLRDKNSILIIEGGEDIFVESPVNPNYIRSILLDIVLNYKIPIIRTENFVDTANYLYLLMKRGGKPMNISIQKKQKTVEDIRLSILKQIPGIGDNLAKKLLDRFKDLRGIFNASKIELEKIVGAKKADLIKRIYEDPSENIRRHIF